MSAAAARVPASTLVPFRRVVCAVEDGPQPSEAARQAAILAGRGGTVALVRTGTESAALTRAGAIAGSLGARCERHATDPDDPVGSLLAIARGHDLLVADAGETAFALATRAPIPVLVARRPARGVRFPDSILAAVDGSTGAHRAAARAAELAARHAALVGIVSSPEHDEAHRAALAADSALISGSTGVAPLILDEEVPAARAIVGAAARLDAALVVVGSRRVPTGGSVSADVARHAGCSVLVVRPE